MSAVTSRLKKLERSRSGDCPVCRNGSVIIRVEGSADLGPPLPPCPACGRPARRVQVELVTVDATTRTTAPGRIAVREAAEGRRAELEKAG
jgi:hypothetical protein